MQRLIDSKTTSQNAEIGSTGDTSVGTYVFELVDEGSWAGTVKVAARIIGRGKQEAVSTFPTYLAITNRKTGAVVDGATGVTAAGIYSVDLSGCEARIEAAPSAGTYSVYGQALFG